MRRISHFFVLISVIILSVACEGREEFSSSPGYRLSFSADTVRFDTLFTTVTSATAYFMVYNNTSSGIRADARIAGGDSSPFRLNVDGEGGSYISGLEIESGDSLFCFITANLPDSGTPELFIVEDSVAFILESGVVQYVRLDACGRNARFLRGVRIMSDTVFTADYAYVIYDSLWIAGGTTLELQPGTELYFHKGAGMIVEGTLIAQGTLERPVRMRGDRLDRLFDDLPYDLLSEQWEGIRLGSGSFGNSFVFCDIHGGEFGIKADSSRDDRIKFTMISSTVHNVAGNGIETTGASISVANSQITNAGSHCVSITGGQAEFNYCTIASFPLWWVGESAISLNNFTDAGSWPLFKADFRNCVITGRAGEAITGVLKDSIAGYPSGSVDCYSVSNSLLMTSDTLNPCFRDVVFERAGYGNAGASNFRDRTVVDNYRSVFMLDSLSLARGISDTVSAFLWPYDLNGTTRPALGADAGCFQFIPY
ncbi:MAG: hypothetical protein IK006_02640 [Bacteroidaceae bacterium]|nr:hypothetical protein [Bacteroidaceae bacterium]